MKHASGALMVLALLGMGTQSARADEKSATEVPIVKAFAPEHGFDDNDNVQIVVTGELPDLCFTRGNLLVERDGNVFSVRQLAWRRNDGVCGSGDLLDSPAPFSQEVSLGRLDAGDYRVIYHPSARTTRERAFHVDHAQVATMDSLNYLSVSNAFIADVVPAGRMIEIVVSGTLSSGCHELVRPIEVKKEGEVYVALPVQRLQENPPADCKARSSFVKAKIGLGDVEPGDYLLHVRSRNGTSVNRVFTVLPLNSPES